MKILFLSRKFYPDIGGVEKHVFEVSKRLAKKGHEITVIAEGIDKNQKVGSIEVYKINVGADDWFKKFRIWVNLWKLRRLIIEADIVHCHDVFFWYLPFRFLYLYKPIYTTFHGYEGYPVEKKEIFVRKVSEILSWRNICIGDFIKKWYGTNPDFVSYGGIESLKLNVKKIKVKKDSAIYIGRLDDDTGILTYIKTYEILRKKFPNFEFSTIGDGKNRELVKYKTKYLGIQKNPEKFIKKYNFVFTSGYLSILQAFSEKKLVFATYSNPLKKDYLKMSPFSRWIILEKSPEKIAEKVEFFIKNVDKKRKIVDEEYEWSKTQTWDSVVKTYLKLWETK